MHNYMHNMCMPTIKTIGQFKFYFWSKEPDRAHVHVRHIGLGIEVLIWLDNLKVKRSCGVARIDKAAQKLVKKDLKEIQEAWNEHFGV